MVCPQCGMGYVSGDIEEKAQHATYCDMMTYGPVAALDTPETVVWAEPEQKILLITDFSPADQKELAHNTARVANRETQYDFGIYRACDPPDVREIRIYLAIRKNRSIGMMLLEKRTHIWICKWSELAQDDSSCIDRSDIPWMWSVGFIWIHPDLRGSGFAKVMFDAALQDVGLKVTSVGWNPPFTDAGERFVRSVCPIEFFSAR